MMYRKHNIAAIIPAMKANIPAAIAAPDSVMKYASVFVFIDSLISYHLLLDMSVYITRAATIYVNSMRAAPGQ